MTTGRKIETVILDDLVKDVKETKPEEPILVPRRVRRALASIQRGSKLVPDGTPITLQIRSLLRAR